MRKNDFANIIGGYVSGLVAALLLSVACIGPLQAKPTKTWGAKQTAAFAVLQDGFNQPDMIYAPFAFWFWDEPLDPSEYPQKAGDMASKMVEKGLNPGYAHPRVSGHDFFGNIMKPSPSLPKEQWLSDDWFEAYGAAVDTAGKHNFYLGYNDEYMWPAGRAAGRVLKQVPDLKKISLQWQVFDVKAGKTIKLPASFFAVAAELDGPSVELCDGNPQAFKMADIRSSTLRVIGDDKEFSWTAPDKGDWRVYVFNKVMGDDVNVLDKRLAPTFIGIVHQAHADHMKGAMGTSIPGVFCDTEGCYGIGSGIPWSDDMQAQYEQTTGRDIQQYMPLLLDNDKEGISARARVDWFNAMSDMYSGFFGEINNWLEERGMYYISNLWEETLQFQTAFVGDAMKAHRQYSMPGNDCLQLKAHEVHDFKEVQSVAEFENRRFMSEIMGVSGWHGFTPVTIKECVNSIIAWGVGHVVPHGIFMTRDFDGQPWLPDWFDESPMWSNLNLWTDFTRRASYINSHGNAVPDVMLLNPSESIWALLGRNDRFWMTTQLHGQYDGNNENAIFRPEIHAMNNEYSLAINELSKNRVEFLIADGHYVKQMKVKKGKLTRENFKFKTVVMPSMYVMQTDVAKALVDFVKGGGCVYAMGHIPTGSVENGLYDPEMAKLMETLQKQPNFVACTNGLEAELNKRAEGLTSPIKFVSGEFPMLQHRRNIDGHDFFWLVNNSGDARECTVQIDGVSGRAAIWNCEDGSVTPVGSTQNAKNSEIKLVFQPHEAYWLVFDPSKKAMSTNVMSLPKNETILTLPNDGWNVSIDPFVQPNLQHAVVLPASLTDAKGGIHSLSLWSTWSEIPANFSGFVDYKKTFDLSSAPEQVVLDLGLVNNMAEVWVNGVNIGARLWPPHRFTTNAFKRGENTIVIRVGNLVNNNYSIPAESGLIGPVTIKK